MNLSLFLDITQMETKPTMVVWFSCGAASAVAAKIAVTEYSNRYNVIVVNNPVKEEGDDNRRFMRDIEEWIGQKIEIATNTDFPDCSAESVWRKTRFMSSPYGAPCTKFLKKRARQEWQIGKKIAWHVLGFTSEETKRHRNFTTTELENVLPILIDRGLTKQDCCDILADEGITLPVHYANGFPNANCIGCVKATSATYWNLVRSVHPEVFKARAEMSREIGAKLVRHKGVRMFLDELPADAKGRSMKTLKIPECGIFCEEKV